MNRSITGIHGSHTHSTARATRSLTTTGSHGAGQTNRTTYNITHNARHFHDKRLGAHVCLHEFVHVLGVPHELHNPLVHFFLKPNWERILQWETFARF